MQKSRYCSKVITSSAAGARRAAKNSSNSAASTRRLAGAGGGAGEAWELGSGSGAEAVCAGGMIVALLDVDLIARTSPPGVAPLAALADACPSGDTGTEPRAELPSCGGTASPTAGRCARGGGGRGGGGLD